MLHFSGLDDELEPSFNQPKTSTARGRTPSPRGPNVANLTKSIERQLSVSSPKLRLFYRNYIISNNMLCVYGLYYVQVVDSYFCFVHGGIFILILYYII